MRPPLRKKGRKVAHIREVYIFGGHVAPCVPREPCFSRSWWTIHLNMWTSCWRIEIKELWRNEF